MTGQKPTGDIEVTVLTGGFDKPYVFGLAMALLAQDVRMDVIGSDEVDSPELHTSTKINFLNLHGDRQPDASPHAKVLRVLSYYAQLIRYSLGARPKIFHILWNNKFQYFDRTLLMAYYKLLGKKMVLTAHNINAAKRDSNDSFLNRLTLRAQYRTADHIFVHTEKMKSELLQEFSVSSSAVTVIPFGINNAVPHTEVTPEEAKQRLGIGQHDRTVLFFGNIGPYKGLDFLVTAFQELVKGNPEYRLIIAGKPRGGCEEYVAGITRAINGNAACRGRVISRIQYIPDEETELYFKAADVLALPYTEVSQSGVLFLAYSFGLPVVGTDVGSFRDDIVKGETGFLCRPQDAASLQMSIAEYFESDLYKSLEKRRPEIRDYAGARNSWNVVGQRTRQVYENLLGGVSA